VTALKTSSCVLFTMLGATIIVATLSMLRVPDAVAALVLDWKVSPLFILLGIYLVYLFLGCFMDGISMLVLTLSFVFPVIALATYHDALTLLRQCLLHPI